MSNATKANKKTGTPIGRTLEISDLNSTEMKASLQTRTRGRFSEEALEVIASSQEGKDSIESDVLYQRLGNQWYAFTTQQDEVFYSPVSAQQVAAARTDEEARIFAEKDHFNALGTTEADLDIDALFHQPTTGTGRKTTNGGGNA